MMPTITAIALESLLHPNTNTNTNTNTNGERDSFPKPRQWETKEKRKHSSYYPNFPALYATPEPGPIPGALPTSDSPSPYIVDRKRRRDILPPPLPPPADQNQNLNEEKEEETPALSPAPDGPGAEEEEVDDGLESMSIASSGSELDDGFSFRPSGSLCGIRSTLSNHNRSDFYDAAEDFFSDGSVSNSSPSFTTNIQKELHDLRLNLVEEVDSRKKTEGDLLHLYKQWQTIAKSLSQIGISIPEALDSENTQLEEEAAALCKEVLVTRLVSEAIERGIARAEAEAIAEATIESKNHEISRLRDRLQYYEAVNHEMSQRNQEAVEVARRQRLRRKTRRSWIWGCIGLSIAVGASLLAYSYIPHSEPTLDADASSPSTSSTGETQAC